jgi:hypothetical protein
VPLVVGGFQRWSKVHNGLRLVQHAAESLPADAKSATEEGRKGMHSGYSHGNVRGRAIIQSPADFRVWLMAQEAPAVPRPVQLRPKALSSFRRAAAPPARPTVARQRRARSAESDPLRQSRHMGGGIVDNSPMTSAND